MNLMWFVVLLAILAVCFTAYLIITAPKRVRLKELELERLKALQTKEAVESEERLKMAALKLAHEKEMRAKHPEQFLPEGVCKHDFEEFQNITSSVDGSVVGFTKVFACKNCGEMKKNTISI